MENETPKVIDILKELREYVEARKNLQYSYIQTKEDGTISYDSIGFIANKLGISDSVLKELKTDVIDSPDNTMQEFVANLTEYAFDFEELVELQKLNDSIGAVDELLEYIDKMIEEE